MIVAARDMRPIHPDLDMTRQTIETRWEDFRPVGDVLRPFRALEVDIESGEWLREIVFESAETNVPIDPAIFRPPD